MSDAKPLPCPFCGVEMTVENGSRKNYPDRLSHPKNDCLLSGYGWGALSHSARWNRRDLKAEGDSPIPPSA